MSKIEKLSELIASEFSKNISMNKDDEEVVAYGAFILIQTILSIIAIAIFGIVFDVFVESMIISFTAAILRKFSGGAHATSPLNCAIIGMIVFGSLALVVKNFIINLNFIYIALIFLACFIFAFYFMYKYSPVGSETKPLKNEKTRERLRKKSLKFLLSLLILNIFMIIIYSFNGKIILLNVAVCISIGVVWQSLTLVSLGHKIIDFLDKLLGGTNKLMRRTN